MTPGSPTRAPRLLALLLASAAVAASSQTPAPTGSGAAKPLYLFCVGIADQSKTAQTLYVSNVFAYAGGFMQYLTVPPAAFRSFLRTRDSAITPATAVTCNPSPSFDLTTQVKQTMLNGVKTNAQSLAANSPGHTIQIVETGWQYPNASAPTATGYIAPPTSSAPATPPAARTSAPPPAVVAPPAPAKPTLQDEGDGKHWVLVTPGQTDSKELTRIPGSTSVYLEQSTGDKYVVLATGEIVHIPHKATAK